MLPLKGFRIIDFTQVMSGPFSTMLLADLGAEVIKVEPFTGDASRKSPPFKEDLSLYFSSLNRSKKSLCIDLKQEDGKKIISELIKTSDVLVENFRPGKMEKLGLGYEEVKRINSDIVYQSITGYNSDSKNYNRSAYDLLIQAESGAISCNGSEDAPSLKLGLPLADLGAALFSTISILSSLVTKRGAKKSVNMYDAQIALMTYRVSHELNDNPQHKKWGSQHPFRVPSGIYTTSDGEVAIHSTTEKFFTNLCLAIDRPYLAKDPLFSSNSNRVKNREELNAVLRVIIKEQPNHFWTNKFDKHDVPYAVVRTIKEALDKKEYNNKLIKKAPNGLKLLDLPITEEGVEYNPFSNPPLLGEHTLEVLSSLNQLSEADITYYLENNIIHQSDEV